MFLLYMLLSDCPLLTAPFSLLVYVAHHLAILSLAYQPLVYPYETMAHPLTLHIETVIEINS